MAGLTLIERPQAGRHSSMPADVVRLRRDGRLVLGAGVYRRLGEPDIVTATVDPKRARLLIAAGGHANGIRRRGVLTLTRVSRVGEYLLATETRIRQAGRSPVGGALLPHAWSSRTLVIDLSELPVIGGAR